MNKILSMLTGLFKNQNLAHTNKIKTSKQRRIHEIEKNKEVANRRDQNKKARKERRKQRIRTQQK